jgi:hypothetical protein
MSFARALVWGIGASAAVGLMLSLAGQHLPEAAAARAKTLLAGEENAMSRLQDTASINYAGAFADYSWSGDWMQAAPASIEPDVAQAAKVVAKPPAPPSAPPSAIIALPPIPHPDTDSLAGLPSYAPPASLDSAPPHAPPLAFRAEPL